MKSFGTVAKGVRKNKETNPERYCPVEKCLWREHTRDGFRPCRRHNILFLGAAIPIGGAFDGRKSRDLADGTEFASLKELGGNEMNYPIEWTQKLDTYTTKVGGLGFFCEFKSGWGERNMFFLTLIFPNGKRSVSGVFKTFPEVDRQVARELRINNREKKLKKQLLQVRNVLKYFPEVEKEDV